MGGIPIPPPPPGPPRPPPWPRWPPEGLGAVVSGSGPILSGSSLRLTLSTQSPDRFTPPGGAASSRSVAQPATQAATNAVPAALNNVVLNISRVALCQKTSPASTICRSSSSLLALERNKD